MKASQLVNLKVVPSTVSSHPHIAFEIMILNHVSLQFSSFLDLLSGRKFPSTLLLELWASNDVCIFFFPLTLCKKCTKYLKRNKKPHRLMMFLEKGLEHIVRKRGSGVREGVWKESGRKSEFLELSFKLSASLLRRSKQQKKKEHGGVKVAVGSVMFSFLVRRRLPIFEC